MGRRPEKEHLHSPLVQHGCFPLQRLLRQQAEPETKTKLYCLATTVIETTFRVEMKGLDTPGLPGGLRSGAHVTARPCRAWMMRLRAASRQNPGTTSPCVAKKLYRGPAHTSHNRCTNMERHCSAPTPSIQNLIRRHHPMRIQT